MLVKPKQIQMVQALPSKAPLCCEAHGNIIFLVIWNLYFQWGRTDSASWRGKCIKGSCGWCRMYDQNSSCAAVISNEKISSWSLEDMSNYSSTEKLVFAEERYYTARMSMWGWIQGSGVAQQWWCMPRPMSLRQDPQRPDLVSVGHLRWPAAYPTVPATAEAMLPYSQDMRLGWRSSWKLDQSFLWKINQMETARLLLPTSIHVRWINYMFISHLFATWSRNISVILHFSVKGS